uniref:Uncharacterized protein n=1 Tax=uncultured bacterium contig00066 TaxID=1181548 RepID=A0A806JYY1_9BACT|nr:hypothetical protein [uncultured bacterium contig00066]
MIIRVRVVSGLGGKIFAQSTRRDKNLSAVAARKIIRKLRLKKSASLAKFLTI